MKQEDLFCLVFIPGRAGGHKAFLESEIVSLPFLFILPGREAALTHQTDTLSASLCFKRRPCLVPSLIWLPLNRAAGEVAPQGLPDYFYVAICLLDRAWQAATLPRNATAGG